MVSRCLQRAMAINIFWPYSQTNSISDQLWVLRTLCDRHNVPCTISNELDPISYNVLIENFSINQVSTITKFCQRHDCTVSVLVTEFLDQEEGRPELYVNGELITSRREYNPELQRRFINLQDLAPNIASFISIAGQPSADSYGKIFSVSATWDFEIPLPILFFPATDQKKYDLYFSGSLTKYRKSVLQKLERQGLRLLVESRFVCEEFRQLQLDQCAFNLNIPQSSNWPWLSTMRVLFGLRNGVLAAQNTAPQEGPLSEFVVQFSDRETLYESGRALHKSIESKCSPYEYSNKTAADFSRFVSSIL